MTMQIDLDHLRAWIGREDDAEELLTPALVHRFNATFDRRSPLEHGAEAPLLIHLCLCQPVVPTAELGPDGHPARGGFLPPIPLPRRMWAGGAFTFHAPIRIGSTVRRRSIIRNVTMKEGRSGMLCFVTVEHHISSDGAAAVTERQDIVYRGVTERGDTPAKAKPAAPAGLHQRRIGATTVLLFRYSALTFNGHRIHYDAPYTREEEGYPGLIVHGPMQATLLCHYATDLRSQTPARFDFRSLSPIFDTMHFMLNAAPDGTGLSLWTGRYGGPVAMEARAEW